MDAQRKIAAAIATLEAVEWNCAKRYGDFEPDEEPAEEPEVAPEPEHEEDNSEIEDVLIQKISLVWQSQERKHSKGK